MSAWHDYVTAALLGAEKAEPPALPAEIEPALGDTAAMEREARFLTHAGALALWRRAGWRPARNEADVGASEPEVSGPVNRASAAHLRAMLGGRCTAVLPEWLGEVARLGLHVPPEFLPALLDRARQDRPLRPLAMAAGGRRAHWLAAHNPDWAFATAEAPELWETGSRDQRVAIVRSLRTKAPAEARAKVEATWITEPADVRAAFVSELATNLCEDDVPFLEAVLDDRSKEVRRAAIDLLARLPSSPFVARMLARATALLVFQRGGLVSRASLDVTLPSDPDAAAARDGLDPKRFGQQKTLGEKAVLLVLILAAVPLRYWTETFQQTPPALLKAAEKNEFSRTLATGWAWAALRQREAAWAEALLEGPVQPHFEFLPGELVGVLPGSSRAERLARMIRAGSLKKAGSPEWAAALAELTVLGEGAPAPLVDEALRAIRASVGDGLPWHLRPPVEQWLLRIPPALLPAAARGWSPDQDAARALVDLLTFRHEALSALSQP